MHRTHDNAIILSLKKHAETSALVALLSEHHGLYHGMVRGAFSAKNRGIYQPGNVVAMEWSARLPDQLGGLRAELLLPFSAHIMPHAWALALMSSACALLAVALPERHPYPKLYDALTRLLAQLADAPNCGLDAYIEFELLLLSEAGFGLDLSKCAATGSTKNLIYVSPKSGRAVCAEAGEAYKARLFPNPPDLATTAYFLEHWLFEHLHRKLPAARKRLASH